ncbi:hypothetical protein ACNKHO_22725 [Shigella flexneri]
MSLAFLPDLKTESTTARAAKFYHHKPDTHAKAVDGYTPRDYLTHWLSQSVRDYGIDGFRVDTAKHVEMAGWRQLKRIHPRAGRMEKSQPPQSAG